MTDKQIVDTILKRAKKVAKEVGHPNAGLSIAMTQQYGKKLYFSIAIVERSNPKDSIIMPLSFSNGKRSTVFVMNELPERLMDWKHKAIKDIASSPCNFIEFDIATFPKEVVHIFSSAIISALNTDGMSVNLMTMGFPALFGADETYEMVQIEADMMEFDNDQDM